MSYKPMTDVMLDSMAQLNPARVDYLRVVEQAKRANRLVAVLRKYTGHDTLATDLHEAIAAYLGDEETK